MKKALITILRNKKTTISKFRKTANQLGYILANETSNYLSKEKIKVITPLQEEANGYQLKNEIILVPILRSGIALLTSFMQFFETAKIGFVGLQRDETTAIAKTYYYKVPKISEKEDVILLDPMIATGGSAIEALKILKKAGAQESKIIFAAVIAATEGIKKIKKEFPKIKIIVAQEDKQLNNKKFIVPGLGDFGDRYFGTKRNSNLIT